MTINICVNANNVWDVRLKLVLMMGEGPHQEIVECTELSHLADYSQPHAPGTNVFISGGCYV